MIGGNWGGDAFLCPGVETDDTQLPEGNLNAASRRTQEASQRPTRQIRASDGLRPQTGT